MFKITKPHLTHPRHIALPNWTTVIIDILSPTNELSFSPYQNASSVHDEAHSCPLWGESRCQNWGHYRNWALLPWS